MFLGTQCRMVNYGKVAIVCRSTGHISKAVEVEVADITI